MARAQSFTRALAWLHSVPTLAGPGDRAFNRLALQSDPRATHAPFLAVLDPTHTGTRLRVSAPLARTPEVQPIAGATLGGALVFRESWAERVRTLKLWLFDSVGFRERFYRALGGVMRGAFDTPPPFGAMIMDALTAYNRTGRHTQVLYSRLMAVELCEPLQLILVAFAAIDTDKLWLVALSYNTTNDELDDVWGVVVHEDVGTGVLMALTARAVEQSPDGEISYLLALVDTASPFHVEYYNVEDGEHVGARNLAVPGIDELDGSVTIEQLIADPATEQLFAHYVKRTADPADPGFFCAHFLLALNRDVEPRVVFNLYGDDFGIVYDRLGYWMYDRSADALVVYRPNGGRRRESVFATRAPDSALALLELRYIPDTERLLVVMNDLTVYTLPLLEYHGIGYAPNNMAAAPRHVRSVVDTFTSIWSIEALATPIGQLPPEILFVIYGYL